MTENIRYLLRDINGYLLRDRISTNINKYRRSQISINIHKSSWYQ